MNYRPTFTHTCAKVLPGGAVGGVVEAKEMTLHLDDEPASLNSPATTPIHNKFQS